MYKHKIFIKAFLFVIFLSLFPIKSLAYEQIIDYGENAKINKDGTVHIKETITYDLGTTPKHGIYRNIPFVKKNQDNKEYIVGIKNILVADDNGYAYPFTISRDSTNLNIKIGDPNKTITGIRIYDISYDLYGALTYFSDHDELYWNFIGQSWQVPVFSSQIYVDLPDNVSLDSINYACFTGVYKSTSTNCSIEKRMVGTTPEIVISANSSLSAGEGLTGVIGFPKNKVAVLEPTRNFLPSALKYIFILLSIIIFLLIPFYFVILWLEDYLVTKNKARIVTAWFEPPHYQDGKQFTPAETACLVNKYVSHKSVSATIIQLAQKGYFKIILEERKKVSFRRLKWIDNNLTVFEQEIMKGLFLEDNTREVVTVKQLEQSTKFTKKIKSFKEMIGKTLKNNGMFLSDPVKTYATFQTITIVYGILFFFLWKFIPFIILDAALFFFCARYSSRKTDLGIEKYAEAVSLKNFLVSQDEELNFQSKNQMFFEKLLPYATAFGVEKIWAKRFEEIQFTQNEWVEGDITNVYVLSNMTTNITTRMRYASLYTPSRSSSGFSSGFGGGGFSGGGGGGGGGGSW